MYSFFGRKSLQVSVPLQEFGECSDVSLRHLQRLELGQFAIAAQRRHHFTQTFEGVVQAVHASTFTGVGCQASLLDNFDGGHFGTPPTCGAVGPFALGRPRRAGLALAFTCRRSVRRRL